MNADYSIERLSQNIRQWTHQIAPRIIREGAQARIDTIEQELWDSLPSDPSFYWNVLMVNPQLFLVDPDHSGGGEDTPWEKVKDALYSELRGVAIRELDVALASLAQGWPRGPLRELRAVS